jgi:hypothetical protein
VESLPVSVRELGDRMEQELSVEPRYVRDCCGLETRLNPGHYEISAVCGWEETSPSPDYHFGRWAAASAALSRWPLRRPGSREQLAAASAAGREEAEERATATSA